MQESIIDAHIHLDLYEEQERAIIVQEMDEYCVDALIAVSQNLASSKLNLTLSQKNNRIHSAFGFHPEQPLPEEDEITALLHFIEKNQHNMTAVGEVGLPYYLRRENPVLPLEPYIELLDTFIRAAVTFHKPIILHAVYEDAPIVCDLLENYSYNKAHFHWFKGDSKTIERMILNGYFISVTPDILYEQEIQEIVRKYPLSQMMVETDGPWPFKGPFQKFMTHPNMIHQSILKIASVKKMDAEEVYRVLYENTKQFYFSSY
jgi:TatD DNase family protein